MFNNVKARLTILYTGSLLLILILFILILYGFISGAIKKEEINELDLFFENERHELYEEYYEHEHRHLEFKEERKIFYYVVDKNQQVVTGEETIRGLYPYLPAMEEPNSTREIEWEKSHLLVKSYPLDSIGTAIIGMDITNEKHLIQNIIWILVVFTVLFSILFAWVGQFFAGQAMKPIQTAFLAQRKFVSDASHELRTPLSIFYSTMDVLSEEENLSPFGKEVLEDGKNEAEMMNKLLNDLLFLARSDQGNMELDMEEYDLSSQLHSWLTGFSRTMPAHLMLKWEIEDHIAMQGDKVRMQQLLYILLENAVRYTKEGSIICTLKKNQKIILSVEDTGIGIAPEELPQIFDRFYRGDAVRKRDGSGLGLSIAKTIVEAHGGTIEVKSKVGKGTQFIVTM
ncbi:sensor histidine kinase [Bacillus tuaregi]|uniref:sensor histidine kinase n=1 Tax=Bacillus tuaregi TaxID=1816695 RepID=UPI0008F8A8B8|nr:HAMP domain-containing sensor histidine kinase [Bacillus tuaregi]